MDRGAAITSVRLLNDLWWDILAGDGLFQLLEERRIPFRSKEHLGCVQRMVFFHLAMVLCKLAEFHRHYSRHLPEDCRLWLKGLSAEVERRGLRDLRNKAIGHIIDKSTGAPLTAERVNQIFAKGVDAEGLTESEIEEKAEQFCRWMRNAKSTDDPDTVMGRVMWLRNRIMEEHGLSAADVGLKLSTS